MSIGAVILVILVLVLLGGLVPFGGTDVTPSRPFYGTGYYGGAGLGLVVLILLVLLLLGRL
jgi:hypothetical protein